MDVGGGEVGDTGEAANEEEPACAPPMRGRRA